MTQRQLMAEVQSHYTQQAVKQLYVLVLGLDVIGNPFGLVLGLTQGVGDLFYEPFQVFRSNLKNWSISHQDLAGCNSRAWRVC